MLSEYSQIFRHFRRLLQFSDVFRKFLNEFRSSSIVFNVFQTVSVCFQTIFWESRIQCFLISAAAHRSYCHHKNWCVGVCLPFSSITLPMKQMLHGSLKLFHKKGPTIKRANYSKQNRLHNDNDRFENKVNAFLKMFLIMSKRFENNVDSFLK